MDGLKTLCGKGLNTCLMCILTIFKDEPATRKMDQSLIKCLHCKQENPPEKKPDIVSPFVKLAFCTGRFLGLSSQPVRDLTSKYKVAGGLRATPKGLWTSRINTHTKEYTAFTSAQCFIEFFQACVG